MRFYQRKKNLFAEYSSDASSKRLAGTWQKVSIFGFEHGVKIVSKTRRKKKVSNTGRKKCLENGKKNGFEHGKKKGFEHGKK